MEKTIAAVLILLSILSAISSLYAQGPEETCWPPPCPARGFDTNGVLMLFAMFLLMGYLFSKRASYAVYQK